MFLGERTHRIPIQNFKLADKDYRRIFSDILAILNPDGTSVTYPPLYCPTEEIKQTKFILQWLQYDTRRSFRPLSLKVYDVAQLMYELYRYSSSQLCSVGLIQDFLCSTSFTFNAQTW